MKKLILLLSTIACLATGCEDFMKAFGRQGELQVRFAPNTIPGTRASALPDTNEFAILITDSDGKSVYDGKYGALKETMVLDEGNYTIVAKSCEFSTPLFDTPQYGDTQVASVKSGKTTVVTLSCYQMNSGIRLNIAPEFLSTYPNGVLYLKSTAGRLMYGYSEKRIAYFLPGTVNLSLANGSDEQTLFSRLLEAQQILTLNISVGNQSGTKSGVVVQVDTSRYWLTDNFVLGGDNGGGSDTSEAFSIGEAKKHCGDEDVWVYGYVVGGDLTSKSCSFKGPFSSRTNMAIASKSSCTDKEACLSVQLAKGDVRDGLNLVDNPELLGKQVFLKGDIVESYYGIPGIQNISEFKIKK